jgi:Rrf2 family iron-sulfur cluster assembly transcriptional regulator
VRLTNRTAYGVQALFDFAFHGNGRAVQARETAERQGIPLRYLEQILQELRRAGLVEAKRGPGGGYLLARAATELRLCDVVAALDGPVESLLSVDESAVENAGVNVPAMMWSELGARVAGLFAGVTVADMVTRAEAQGVARASHSPQMYFI